MIETLRILLLTVLNHIIRRSALLTWLLFRVRVINAKRIHWDFTTLVLKKCLSQELRPHLETLEIGTGPYALLAIYCAKRSSGRITASDISSSYCQSARRTANLNSAKIEIIQSDLFENIADTFDLILFNAVYIPRALGAQWHVQRFHDSESDWCGGDEGWETIARFLFQAKMHLKPAGKILLGFNPHYLPRSIVEEHCRQYHYEIVNQCAQRFNPSIALILQQGD